MRKNRIRLKIWVKLKQMNKNKATMNIRSLLTCVFTLSCLFSTTSFAKTVRAPLAEKRAIFKAAGFQFHQNKWQSECGEPTLELYQDINHDHLPEAIVSSADTGCYGLTGMGFVLLSKTAQGVWRVRYDGTGVPELLKSTGKNRMPDVSVGGPGFCFPVLRWDGSNYRFHRYEYEGKACQISPP